MPPNPSVRTAAARLLLACSVSPDRSQTATTASSVSPGNGNSAAGETVELSPFVVSSSVQGYMASDTISGTAMNAPLREVPMTISVITSEFLDDALVGDLANAFDYNSSITQTNRQPVGNREASWSIRGFRNRNILIDGVSGGDFIPTHLIDRIEVVKGPNTLYGQSDPGGLVNIVTKRPTGTGRARIRQRIGEQTTTTCRRECVTASRPACRRSTCSCSRRSRSTSTSASSIRFRRRAATNSPRQMVFSFSVEL